MKNSMFLGLMILAGAGAASAQTATSTTTTTETQPVMVTGEVVRYEPGHMIVIRNPERREITYTIGSSAEIPADLAMGRRISLWANPDNSVTRVTTTMQADGSMKKTTETTHTNQMTGAMTKTTTTEITGTVSAYEAGKSVTVQREDGSLVTYTLGERSHLPMDLAVGKTIVLHPMVGADDRMVDTVTYTTVKTDKHGKTTTKSTTKVVH